MDEENGSGGVENEGEARGGADGAGRPRHERVGAADAGQRVDNFLLRRAPGVPKGHLYRLIRTGEVRVDGRRVKQTRRLREGEQVRIPALRTAARGTVQVPDRLADTLAAAVVLEHEDFLVVAKPPGVAVHGGSGLAFGLIDALRQRLDAPRLELVHRLDRGTSGALLIARDNGRNRELQTLFRERTIEKDYLALVDGHWPERQRMVDAPLAKNVEHAGERRVVVAPGGQRARSRFRIVRSLPGATLVEVRIETGRTHQIRVHLSEQKMPLVGDTVYGGRLRIPKGASEELQTVLREFPRQALHARRLSLIHPVSGEECSWESPLPDDMLTLLAALRLHVKNA